MRDLLKAKYYVYLDKRGGLLPYDIVYQNSDATGRKWLECVVCGYTGHWTSGGDVSTAWVRSIQHRKLKPEQIPEKVLALADELVQP